MQSLLASKSSQNEETLIAALRTEPMADGKEEREEQKARLEEEKKVARQGDGNDREPVFEGQPEKGGS